MAKNKKMEPWVGFTMHVTGALLTWIMGWATFDFMFTGGGGSLAQVSGLTPIFWPSAILYLVLGLVFGIRYAQALNGDPEALRFSLKFRALRLAVSELGTHLSVSFIGCGILLGMWSEWGGTEPPAEGVGVVILIGGMGLFLNSFQKGSRLHRRRRALELNDHDASAEPAADCDERLTTS